MASEAGHPLRVYRFGPFEADATRRELRKHGVRIRLEHKPWQLLLVLLERPGKTVTRAEIQTRLWPDGVFVDFEHGVNVAVKKLRHALLDSASSPRYIETVVNEGYRFIGILLENQPIVESVPLGDSGSPPAISGEPHPIVSEGRWRWRVAPWQMAVPTLAVALIALASAWSLATLRTSTGRQSMVVTRLIADGQARVSGGTSISPDGKYVAYEAVEAGRSSVWVRQLASGSTIRLADFTPGGRGATTFSRDSSFLVYEDGNKIMTVPILGGDPHEVARGANGSVCTSQDGRIAYTRNLDEARTALVVVDGDGANPRLLAQRRRPENWFLLSCSWSPDGKRIAVGGNPIPKQGGNAILSVDVESGTVTRISEQTWGPMGRLNWLTDNSGIVFEAANPSEPAQLYEVSLPAGTATRLTGDMTVDYQPLSTVLADDGKTAVAIRHVSESKIWILPAGNSSAPRRLSADTADEGIRGLASASDGRVLFSSNASSSWGIWIFRPAQNSAPRQLTKDQFGGTNPQVTPDGRYLVFAGKIGKRSLPMREALDGSNFKPLGSGGTVALPTVAPDSKFVFYGRDDSASGGGWALWKANIDSGEESLVVSGQIWPLGFTPDGKLMLAWSFLHGEHFSLFSTESWEVVKTLRLPAPALRAAENFAPPRLTPDGKSVSYIDVRDGAENIWAQSIVTGEERQVTHFENQHIFSFTWSARGDLIMARGTQTSEPVLIRGLR